MKKRKTYFRKEKFISPKSYIKKPSIDINEKELSKVENIEQFTKVKELKKKRLDEYNLQQSEIAIGKKPSKLTQEVKSLTRQDPFRRVKAPKPQVAPMYSREQRFMRTFFGHGDKVIFNNPNSRSLPVINGSLMPNHLGDNFEEEGTAETFGLGVIRRRSGLF